MRILAEDTMALIIDFQEKLLPVINNREELMHNTGILIKGLKALSIPMRVFDTCSTYDFKGILYLSHLWLIFLCYRKLLLTEE